MREFGVGLNENGLGLAGLNFGNGVFRLEKVFLPKFELGLGFGVGLAGKGFCPKLEPVNGLWVGPAPCGVGLGPEKGFLTREGVGLGLENGFGLGLVGFGLGLGVI